MKEIGEVVRAYEEAARQGKRTALATVVHVEGSSYRRPGARMLVDDEGRLTGAISGGCLDGDALTKALLVLNQQKAKLVTYDTTDEDDAKFGIGLGCNGIIQVLIEPIDARNACNPVELLKTLAKKRQKAVLVTIFSLNGKRGEQPGTCMLVSSDGVLASGATPPLLQEVMMNDATAALTTGISAFKIYAQDALEMAAFVEYIPPPVSLVIFGAGNDVVPVTKMANILGWRTTVIDGRSTHAKAERFAPGCQVQVAKPEEALAQINFDTQTAVLLMTHNYNYDLAILAALLKKETAYIGVLGPKKKLCRMLDGLQLNGFDGGKTIPENLYGPCGLDIGAETPEEIALSILAEIKAVLSGKAGGLLRNNPKEIHSREATLMQRVKLA